MSADYEAFQRVSRGREHSDLSHRCEQTCRGSDCCALPFAPPVEGMQDKAWFETSLL